jgi:hypothetical protein
LHNVVPLVPKDDQKEIRQMINHIIAELTVALKYFKGKDPHTVLIGTWLQFFQGLLGPRNEEHIRKLFRHIVLEHSRTLDPFLDNEKLHVMEHRVFAAETSLQQRNEEITALRTRLEEVTRREQSQAEGLQALVSPAIEIGEKEIAAINTLTELMGGLKSELSYSLLSLAEAIGSKQKPAQQTVNSPDMARVLDELTRRQAWLDEIEPQIQSLGEERNQIQTDLEEARQSAKFMAKDPRAITRLEARDKAISKHVTTLLANQTQVRAELRKLETYVRAVETARTGAPVELLGKDLPPVTLLPEATEKKEIPFPAPVGKGNERYVQLRKLGETFEVTPEAVLIISLYDCLPTATRKSVASVIKAAEGAGINDAFGLPKNIEIINSWRNDSKTEKKYLHYRGAFGGAQFVRTGNRLDWSVKQILTPEEIASFLEEINRKTTE